MGLPRLEIDSALLTQPITVHLNPQIKRKFIKSTIGGLFSSKSNNEVTVSALDKMLNYTEETFRNKWNLTFDDGLLIRIESNWGQSYDFEQMLEHAIVHILRHRRQIERFLLLLKEQGVN